MASRSAQRPGLDTATEIALWTSVYATMYVAEHRHHATGDYYDMDSPNAHRLFDETAAQRRASEPRRGGR